MDHETLILTWIQRLNSIPGPSKASNPIPDRKETYGGEIFRVSQFLDRRKLEKSLMNQLGWPQMLLLGSQTEVNSAIIRGILWLISR